VVHPAVIARSPPQPGTAGRSPNHVAAWHGAANQ
jgi:hypothetical protein